ncbi:MAG: hypothetical protein ACI9LV_000463 [Candidatus Nanohaloarchaea archaeon]|jgi:hypothetical protein
MIKDSGLKARAIILGALVLFASGQAAAATVTLQDSTIWLHDNQDKTLNGQVQCQNGNSVSSLEVVFPDGSSTTVNQDLENGDSFTYNLENDNSEGVYETVLECSSGNTDSKEFTALQLHVEKISPNEQINRFRGDQISADIRARVNGSSGNKFSLSNADFAMTLYDTEPVPLESIREVKSSSGENIYSIEGDIPQDIEPGSKFLESSVTYTPETADEPIDTNIEGFSVEVEKSWNFDITNRTPDTSIINYQNVNDLTLETDITYKGEPENTLSSSDFYLTVKDSNGTVFNDFERKKWISSSLQGSNGEYELKLSNIPALPKGEYNWVIGLDKDEGQKIVELPVYNYLFLSGTIHDAQGKGVDSEILIGSDSAVARQFNADDGEYRGRVLPGRYNFTVNFPELSATFNDVELEEGVRGSIRYDEIPQGDVEGALEGISVVNAVGVVFGYPVSGDVTMDMSYDPSGVSFDNARVVECKRWLLNRECWGEWNTLNRSEVTLYPTVGRAEFEGEAVNVSDGRKKVMSAYMIVRNTELTLENVNMEMGRHELGSSQSVDGKIVTPSGDSVSSVNVEISIVKEEEVFETVTAQTNANGNFGTQINLPEEPGIYSVKIEAQRDPYQGFETTLSGNIETFIRKSVSVNVPEDIEFYPGESSQTSFTVINDGQAEATNVKLRINGLKNTWYEFDQASWDSIEPGGSREATMTVELPTDYCGDQCTEYPTFNAEVVATSDEESINDIQSVQSVVTKERSVNSSQSESEDQESSFSMPDVQGATGQFLEQRSSLNIALGLATVFILALAVSVKKKKESDSGRNRLNNSSGGSRPVQNSSSRSVSKPDVGSKEEVEGEEPSESQAEEESGSDEATGHDESSAGENEGSESSHKCGVCGEEFDTESALDLHEQAMH